MQGVITRGNGTVEVVDLPKPRIEEPGDVILKVTAAAVCGTDLHFIRVPFLSPTTALGHEFIGEIDEVGTAVRDFAPGQRAKSRMFVCCGRCVACVTGQQTKCPEYRLFGAPSPTGAALSGGQAEYVRIPQADRTLTHLAEGLTDANALLLTDTLPTAWEAIVRTGPPAGKSFAVVGAGPVGQQVIAVAYALGASVVYAVDLDDKRLAAAQRLGAIPVSGTDAPGQHILDLHGRGVDVAIDAVGSQSAIDTAMAAVAPGGVVGLVGAILFGEITFSVEALVHKGVDVRPIMGNPYASEHLITPLLTSGRLSLPGLVDVSVPLVDAVGAYESFAARRVNKIVLLP